MARKAAMCILGAWIFVLVALTGTSAKSITVGGVMYWMAPVGGLNYTQWAQNTTAHVNDTLYFKYNPNAHNVLHVSSEAYAACNTSNFISIWDTGDTTVLLEEVGMHYFMCGALGNCAKGQAFGINVSRALATVSPPTLPPESNSPPDNSAALERHHCRKYITVLIAAIAAISFVVFQT